MAKQLEPCSWAQGDLYLAYHKKEWGEPCYDEKRLFEKICLEGQQAGLSWITILKKRENYRKAFFKFNPKKVAAMSDEDLEERLLDKGIIRNRLKVYAIRNNAQAYLALKAEGIYFRDFLWEFVDNEVKVNHFSHLSKVPTETPESQAMSKALKKKGFKFIGPTICYAFMQSMGMVNDHMTNCPEHPDNKG
ncbi:DNA-3-methyladenine glycosidase [Gammaproteobacteria bacterium 45_16_T64]|nr:DNA-3-methyladenine glycosidase [Gammaproteobacteria bacterium 45_16_T64]